MVAASVCRRFLEEINIKKIEVIGSLVRFFNGDLP